jgi:glycosyltransferase involved in cell wall biosynthesis
MKLSFCVPTWNGARFLPATLRSLLEVRGVELEVVIGDDASSDGSAEVARKTAAELERGRAANRVTVHAFRDRLGLAGNWNRTLRLARGDVVCLFGQDDRCVPGFAEKLVAPLERHPECALAFGRREFELADDESRAALGDFFERRYPEMLRPFDERLRAVGESIPPEVMIEEAMRFLFEINLVGEPSFVVMRRDHPAVMRGFDERMEQMIDWELFTRFFADAPLARCHEVVGTYHVHQSGSSLRNSRLSRHYREYDYLLGLVLDRFARRLAPEQAKALAARREEARRLAVEHAAKEAKGTEGAAPAKVAT